VGLIKCVEEKKISIMTSTTANQGTEADVVKNYLQDIHTMQESHFSSLKSLVALMNSNLSQAQKVANSSKSALLKGKNEVLRTLEKADEEIMEILGCQSPNFKKMPKACFDFPEEIEIDEEFSPFKREESQRRRSNESFARKEEKGKEEEKSVQEVVKAVDLLKNIGILEYVQIFL
jgi:hypothetical protein